METQAIEQRIERTFRDDAYSVSKSAQRYYVVRNMPPSAFQELWLRADTLQDFDRAVDAYAAKHQMEVFG